MVGIAGGLCGWRPVSLTWYRYPTGAVTLARSRQFQYEFSIYKYRKRKKFNAMSPNGICTYSGQTEHEEFVYLFLFLYFIISLFLFLLCVRAEGRSGRQKTMEHVRIHHDYM